MTASTILSLILMFLRLANNLYSYLHDRKLIEQGRDQQIKEELVILANRVKLLRQIDERFEKMKPEEVIRELEGHGDFRD